MGDFERALKKLITDAYYRKTIIEDWEKLTQDFGGLTGEELLLLMQVWNATAHDESKLEAFRCVTAAARTSRVGGSCWRTTRRKPSTGQPPSLQPTTRASRCRTSLGWRRGSSRSTSATSAFSFVPRNRYTH